MRLFKLLALPALMLMPLSANASPTLKGSFGDWTVYSRYDGAQRLCYVVAHAKSKSPASVRHGDIHFLVANWKSGIAFEQPSFMADFSLKADRPPSVQIDGQKFPMYVSKNESFIAERSDEVSLINRMRAGSTMKVSAVSGRGTNVSYTFSLNGITAALERAQSDCN
ncbi:MAG: hypothetical protein HKN36_13110 [Hellea sp.]|nr:hypothetical protein [Hellea sp.]